MMEKTDQETYESLLRYLDWKDFPESELLKTKTLFEALDLMELSTENRQKVLSSLSDIADNEHRDLAMHRWDGFLETMEDIWIEAPQAFGRYFLERYYRNNDSPFGEVLRNLLRSAPVHESDLSYTAWLVMGELVIFQLSFALAEAIFEGRLENPDALTGENPSPDPRKKIWFLPGPVMLDPERIMPFPTEEKDGFEEMLSFFATVFEPGSTLTKLMTIDYPGMFHQFSQIPGSQGDIRYAWSDQIVSRNEAHRRFTDLIEDAFYRVQEKLCQRLVATFPSIRALLIIIQREDHTLRSLVFKQRINLDNPSLGMPIVRWWDQVHQHASGKTRQAALTENSSSASGVF